MISVKKAAEYLRKKAPELTIIKAVDYDSKYYLFSAVENPNEPDFNDPYYVVDKNTGEVYSFSPMKELPKFLTALHTKTIKGWE